MEPPVAIGGNAGGLSLQGPGSRKEWRVVNDSSLRERVIGDGSDNQARMSLAGRPRSDSGASRRSSRNGQVFHPSGSGHSSDSDHHGGDIGGAHLIGAALAPQELIPQIIGQGDEAVLYEEMHRSQQRNEHLDSGLSSMSMDSGLNSMESPDEAFQQRLHEVSRQREQLQQAEVELRAQFIARSEVIRMQNGLDEQSKQHSEIVSNLQGQIQEREQQIHHLEQQLEERERQLHVNQMETNEAVWAKDGLLREQTNELATLRRDRDSAITEHQAAAARLDAERAESMEQLENLKEQVRDKERRLQEAEEQSRSSQEIILFKDDQLRDAQAWMARAQELDAYHVNANNTLHGELRERTEQMNQLWLGYQRQLADIERYHAQVIQRLQQEITEAREQIRVLKGPAASDCLDVKEERPSVTDSSEVGCLDAKDDAEVKGSRILMAVSAAHSRKSNIVANGNNTTNGNLDGLLPVVLQHDGLPPKVEHLTGPPVVPAPILGMTSVLPPSGPTPGIHQFGIHQQGMPQNLQPSPLQVPQPALTQLQPIATVLAPQHHMPPLQHQQVLHPHHHQPHHQSSQVHRLSQRSQTQPPSQQTSLPQLSHLALSHGQQTRHQELQQQQHVQISHDKVVPQAEQHNTGLLTQASPILSHQISHGQVMQQQQQLTSQLLHQQQKSIQSLPVSVPEQDTTSATQQSRPEEPQSLPVDLQQQDGQEQQQPELIVQHRQQSSQQERQSHERHRLDPRLTQYSLQQPKQPQGQSHQLSPHETNVDPQPQQLQQIQQLQHQQGLSSSLGHLGGSLHSPSILAEDDTSGHTYHDISVNKSTADNQEFQKATQVSKQHNYGETGTKGVEPVLLDERSLLDCLVRAIPAEPTSRIRISSTLPNRLGKMLAPLHWHDYRKQFGRLDEFVGSHSELFVIEGDFINLREGAHATFSATTAVAKAAAAAAAVTPVGPSRIPTVAVTPVAQSTLHRGRSLKSSIASQKEGKGGPVTMQDSANQSPSSPQTEKTRQIQTPNSTRSEVENGNANVHHPTASIGKSGMKSEGQHSFHAGGSRTNGSSSENSGSFENGGINGYVSSARAGGYYRQHGRGPLTGSGQYRKQENHVRPQTQEGRVGGPASTKAE